MARLRVFVSHSTRDELAGKVRAAVVGELGAAGHQVLVDADVLKEGDPWRNKLNVCIGLCDAAVVLLSRPALQSAWVAYEVSVLAYRAAFDPAFELIPVFIRVDYKDLESSILSPSQVQEWQAVRPEEPLTVDGEADQAWIDAVARRAAAALPAERPGEPTLERKLLHLSFLLRKIDDDQVLAAACEELELNLREWLPTEDLARRVACTLHALPSLDEAAVVIDTLRQYLPGERKIAMVLEMLDVVACSWVSEQAARQVGACVRSAGALSLDCSLPLTVEMVVARACPRRLTDDERWPVVAVDDVDGEALEEIQGKIRRALLHRLCLEDGSKLLEHLRKRRDRNKPAFVSISSAGLTEEEMRQLQDAFAGAVFFWRSAGDTAAEEAPGVERIRPPLAAAGETGPFDEGSFEREYTDAKDMVML